MGTVVAVVVERLVSRGARVAGGRAGQHECVAAVARRRLGWKTTASEDGRLGGRTVVDRRQTRLVKSVSNTHTQQCNLTRRRGLHETRLKDLSIASFIA